MSTRLIPSAAKPAPAHRDEIQAKLQPTETTIDIAPYKAKQLYMVGYSNRGDLFDAAKEPMRTLYNEYFGGSMNAIVFQEMRESRSLAYSACSRNEPSEQGRSPICIYEPDCDAERQADGRHCRFR